MTSPITLLSVNVNKIAVLRNSRGGELPNVVTMAEAAMDAGCGGITVHPRPDQRHIRPDDVFALAQLTRGRVEFNIEGNPFAPERDGYPGLLALVEHARPTQVTLVPDGDGQLTSDHGFDLARDGARIAPLIAQYRALGCRVSLFMDVGATDIERAAELLADRVEFYTGPYAQAYAKGDAKSALAQCVDCARRAAKAGLGINAGHDLSQSNLDAFLRALPQVREVSIGHALIAEALYAGLPATVRGYLRLISEAAAG